MSHCDVLGISPNSVVKTIETEEIQSITEDVISIPDGGSGGEKKDVISRPGDTLGIPKTSMNFTIELGNSLSFTTDAIASISLHHYW